MQVRKYEATTIKEAVEMVKKDLGPDAIILSTRESVRNLGAKSGKRVLVTAAVAEQTYQMKKLVEENITAREREKLLNRPVREQREFINQVFGNLKTNIDERRRKIETRNYASIPDEDFHEEHQQPAMVKRAPAGPSGPSSGFASALSGNVAKKRVRAAAEEAYRISTEKLMEKPKAAPQKTAAKPAVAVKAPVASFDTQKIDELKKEIQRLKDILKGVENFPGVPAAAAPVATHAGTKLGIASHMSAMFEKLISEGFEERLAASLLRNAENQLKENSKKRGLLEAWLAKWIFASTDVVKNTPLGRYHFFVGPRGAGKTSTLVKMASHLVIKEKKRIAIITTDTNKVGATEQLKIYAQILNVPFAVWRQGQDLNVYLRQIENVDHILFDTEGRSLSNMEEIDSLKQLIPSSLGSVRVHLVLSALLKDEELYSAARRFKSMNYNDVIFTNVDQLRRHGLLVNFQQQVRTPYFAFSMGPMIPEDFEWASKERVLDLIFKISSNKTEMTKSEGEL